MPGLFELNGAQAQKTVPFVPIFIEDLWPGLYTNRALLHDPSGLYERKYMGGRPGSMLGGLNTEVSVRNTVIRRYGTSAFSAATYPTYPQAAFSFEHLDGTIQVIVDTSDTGALAITSVANASAGTTVYTGTITGGGSNAYVGMVFAPSGFTNASNNNPTNGFIVTASTTTTLTLANPGGVAETTNGFVESAGALYIDNQDGTKTFLFGKLPGAGQTHFVAVAGILYMGDGVDQIKYTPGNINGSIWNWGIATPTVAPTIVITQSATAAAKWVASTVFSTMGLIVDGNGNAEAMISVNASGTNATQLGKTGDGEPAWNQTPGGTTTDGGVTWTNWGPVPAWVAHTLYANAAVGGTTASPSQIYDPTSNTVQLNIAAGSASATSGPSKPAFVAIQGATLHDPPGGNTPPNVKWFAMSPPPTTWKKSHAYTTFLGTDTSNTAIVEPSALPGSATSPVTMQICTTAGTSGSGGTQPPFPVLGTKGIQTNDGDLVWLSLGSATRANTTQYTAWNGQGSLFSAIKVGSRMYVCTIGGLSAGSTPSFAGTTYGDTVGDGTVTWTDVGPAMTWVASTQWYLPTQGFAPKSPSQPYGGASIIGTSDGDLITVIASGLSGSGAEPTWNAPGSTTTDNAATWFNEGTANTNALVWQTSHTWGYSYKARATTDFYSQPFNGIIPVPPGITAPPYPSVQSGPLPNPPTGSQTGAISSTSPTVTITGANTGAVVSLTVPYSNDPQVDTIVFYRDADGGGPDQMFEVSEIPNIPQPAGTTKFVTWQDFYPDIPETVNGVQYPGLNTLEPAPIDDVNDPPPAGFLPMAYNFQRIWGSVGSSIFFSGGPDTFVGNPNEAFNPSDEFPYLSNVIRAVKSTSGLVVYTANSIELIGGGPLTASFASITLAPGIGLGNYNSLDLFAGEQFFMDTTGQIRVLSPTLSLTSAGQPITDQLIKLDPKTVYIAFNEQPNDSAIYIGTGKSGFSGLAGSPTGWFRMNPRQVPGGANGPEPVWSPFAKITQGCIMLQSIEIKPGVKKLLAGTNQFDQPIAQRDLSVFTDLGTSYDANFQIGNIWLAHRGEMALLKFLEADFALVTTNPTVSFLLNEISGTYTNFTSARFDPPSLYGDLFQPTSYNPLRYYFSQTGQLAQCVHCQLGIDFGTNANADEIYNLTIYGAIVKGK